MFEITCRIFVYLIKCLEALWLGCLMLRCKQLAALCNQHADEADNAENGKAQCDWRCGAVKGLTDDGAQGCA